MFLEDYPKMKALSMLVCIFKLFLWYYFIRFIILTILYHECIWDNLSLFFYWVKFLCQWQLQVSLPVTITGFISLFKSSNVCHAINIHIFDVSEFYQFCFISIYKIRNSIFFSKRELSKWQSQSAFSFSKEIELLLGWQRKLTSKIP